MSLTNQRAFNSMSAKDFEFTLLSMGKQWMLNNFGCTEAVLNSRAKVLGVNV